MKYLKLSTVIVLSIFEIILNTELCLGYRILGIFPLNAKSHMVFLEQVAKGLARRGHQVDVISIFPQKKPYPNYTDIEIPAALPKFVNNMTHDFLQDVKKSNIVHFMSTNMGNVVCEKGLGSSKVLNIIKNPPKNPPYDLVITECLGFRILGIFPLNARSHMIFHEQISKGLARRGHQVDVISTFPQKKPLANYTDLPIPAALQQFVNNLTHEFVKQEMEDNDIVHFISENAGNLICEKGFENSNIQNIINNPPKNPPYDLVMVEIFAAHCFMAFGYHLKVPVVGLSSSALYPWSNDMIANPPNLAFVPNNLLEYMEKMNFWQRLYNVIHTYYYRMYFNYYTSPQNDMIKKYFGADAPGVRELEHDLALILTNSHLAINGPRPTTPALVEVGGLHIQDDDPDIPADHLKWLNESKDGFIYFTFGSMMQIESFPKPVLDILYKSLGKISPIRVFMKAPQPEKLPPGLPKNIRTFTWMPQLKVLKHKNIRAFITHGGLMGTQEAIHSAVPMIGMPLFADQFINVDLYVSKKIAIRLDYADMTEDKLDAALHEILYNPLYRDTVKKISDKFLDRPMTPLDTACYWIEYVIKHGNKALRSSALDLYWWQVALVDVYAVLIITALIIAFAAIAIIKFISNIIFPSTTVARSKKNN